MSILKIKGRGQNLHLDLVTKLEENIAANGTDFASPELTRNIVSLESLSPVQQQEVGHAADNMINSLRTTLQNVGMESFDERALEIGLEAGAIAAMASGNPVAYAQAGYNNNATPANGVKVIDSMLTGLTTQDYREKVSLEAFDERQLREFLPYSIAFNIYASRQDEFSESFYPTVVVTPDQAGLDVTVSRMLVFNEVHHAITGAASDFKKVNLLDAVVDYTILADETTRLYPVLSTSPSNANLFAPAAIAAPKNVLVGGVPIVTAPLLMGQKIDLLGASQSPALIGAGIIDNTDSIDARITLDAVYLAFGPVGGTQGPAIKFNTSRLARNTFVKTQEGNYRDMALQFSTQDLLLNSNTVADDGSTVSQLAGIVTGNYTVRLQVNVDGRAQTEFGNVNVYASPITVWQITDDTGTLVDPTAGAGLAVVNALAGMSLVAYDLHAYRTNSNRRTRGLLLDTTYETERYTIPLGAPISAPSPITSSRDASDLKSLIQAARIRNSNNAVSALFSYADALLAYVAGPKPTEGVPAVQGMGRFLVTPFYEEHTIDLVLAINSITSNDRAADISATLVNCIRDVVYRMYQQSRYQAALDAYSGDPSKKPTLLVGTDQVLSRHLIVSGDTRTFGTTFEDHKLVVSQDERMYNKIVLTFVRPDVSGPDPLSFGTHAWIPELTSSVMVNRNGATIKEAMVQPRTLHVNNLPVMAILTVKNLSTVLSETIVFSEQQVNGGTGTGTGSNIAAGSAYPDGTTDGSGEANLAP
jgi:hypothetical protein